MGRGGTGGERRGGEGRDGEKRREGNCAVANFPLKIPSVSSKNLLHMITELLYFLQ